MLLTRNWKPTANEGFAIIDLNKWDEAVVWCLCLVETNTLGDVDYHKGATLLIRHVLWGCMESSDSGGTYIHRSKAPLALRNWRDAPPSLRAGLERRIFCQRF